MDLDNLKAFVDSLTVENGYPCSHRRMKLYVSEVGIDNFTRSDFKIFKSKILKSTILLGFYFDFIIDCELFRLHDKYCKQIGDDRILPYPTFMKYMRSHHVNVAIVRAKEDCCDTCLRLSIAAQDANIGEEERGMIEEAQRLHANDARTQRVALKEAIKLWGKSAITSINSPDSAVFDDAVDSLPDSLDDDFRKMSLEDDSHSPNVRLQCEDYGGNLTLPHYGRLRPGRDYYVSNLSVMNFIISDLTTGYNHVLLYDERAMGKGCDALCSLRWMYHFKLYINSRDSGKISEFPDTLYLIMDNCVGQNKSQVQNESHLQFQFISTYNILSILVLLRRYLCLCLFYQ